METYHYEDYLMKEDLENKMLAAAISAVLLFEPEGSIIKISSGRDEYVV